MFAVGHLASLAPMPSARAAPGPGAGWPCSLAAPPDTSSLVGGRPVLGRGCRAARSEGLEKESRCAAHPAKLLLV